MTREYKARNGQTRYMPSVAQFEAMIGEQEGWCVACGEEQSGVEPDARRYTCECCGEQTVYGAEEMVLMGLVHTD